MGIATELRDQLWSLIRDINTSEERKGQLQSMATLDKLSLEKKQTLAVRVGHCPQEGNIESKSHKHPVMKNVSSSGDTGISPGLRFPGEMSLKNTTLCWLHAHHQLSAYEFSNLCWSQERLWEVPRSTDWKLFSARKHPYVFMQDSFPSISPRDMYVIPDPPADTACLSFELMRQILGRFQMHSNLRKNEMMT